MDSTGNQPAESAASEAEKRAKTQREVILAYKRALATDNGRIMFADVCARFGFDKHEHENSSYTFGAAATDLAWKEGTKDPIRHMLKMRDTVLRPLGEKKPRRQAKSGLAPGQ